MGLECGSPGKRVRGAGRRAFTLVEMVLAAALAAILLVGLQSVVMVAAKAIPTSAPGDEGVARGRALNRIAMDLTYAKTVSIPTGSELVLTVGDRDGDAADDTITYQWSGTPGDPLVRRHNATASETMLSGVTGVSVVAETEDVTSQTYVESGETLLGSYSAASGTGTFSLATTYYAAQSIPVTLPADALDFRTTRLRLMIEKDGTQTGTSTIEVRSFRGSQPMTRVLGSLSVAENTLPSSASWVSFSIPSSRYIDRDESLGVVVSPVTTGPTARVTYHSTGAPASAGAWLTSANSGGTWTYTAGRALLYELWGVYRTLGDPETVTRVKSVRVVVSTDSPPALELTLPLCNRPEVAP